MWVLGAIFAAVGLPFLLLARAVFRRDAAALAWPRVPGTIVSSAVTSATQKVREKSGAYYDRTMWTPHVRYTYEAQGQRLEGTSIARAYDGVQMGEDVAKKAIEPYPPGKTVEVLVDPSDPTKTHLEVHRSIGAIILAAFGCLWLAIGSLLIVLSFL